MNQIYFLVTAMETWQLDGRFLPNYFITNGGFVSALVIALVVALFAIAIFYGWIGTSVDRLATVPVWIITMIIAGVVAFGVTQAVIIGSSNAQTGVFNDIVNYTNDLTKDEKDPNLAAQFLSQSQKLKEDLSSATCDVVLALNLENAVLSMFFFFLMSLCVKKLPPFTKYIPF